LWNDDNSTNVTRLYGRLSHVCNGEGRVVKKYLIIFEDGERRSCIVSNLKELYNLYYEEFKEEKEIIQVTLLQPWIKETLGTGM
jgi:hypothetical protein